MCMHDSNHFPPSFSSGYHFLRNVLRSGSPPRSVFSVACCRFALVDSTRARGGICYVAGPLAGRWFCLVHALWQFSGDKR